MISKLKIINGFGADVTEHNIIALKINEIIDIINSETSHNNNFTAHSDSPKVCPQCEGHGRIYVYPDDNDSATICYKCEGTGKAS